MAYIFSSGDKGGSGKSTFSHLCAHGLSLLRPAYNAIVITTDPREDPLLDTDGRRYLVLDGRSAEKLAAVVSAISTLDDDPIVLIDGAAARHELDAVLSQLLSPAAVIVPYMSAAHEFERARRTIQEIPGAYGLPSAWSTREADVRRRETWTAPAATDHILAPVPRMAAMADLLSLGGASKLNYRANKLAKEVAISVLQAAGIEHVEIERKPPPRRVHKVVDKKPAAKSRKTVSQAA